MPDSLHFASSFLMLLVDGAGAVSDGGGWQVRAKRLIAYISLYPFPKKNRWCRSSV